MKRSAPRIAFGFLALIIVWKDIHGKPIQEILNGIPAEIEEYPFIVGLLVYGSQYCGGTIIADRYVLTAAHCLIEMREVDVAVFCGSPYKSGNDGAFYQSEEFIIHQFYYSEYYANDIALIRIKYTFEFSAKVQPIQVADFDFPINTGDLCDIVGWGHTEVLGGTKMEQK